MTDISKIEFIEWDTPFKDSKNGILELSYVGSEAENTDKNQNLEIRLHDYDNDLQYFITFSNISAFRLIDEHGLTEFWGAGPRTAMSTFKVRNHSWHRESPLSFFSGESSDGQYSYVLATDWDCVEVICKNAPIIKVRVKDTK